MIRRVLALLDRRFRLALAPWRHRRHFAAWLAESGEEK